MRGVLYLLMGCCALGVLPVSAAGRANPATPYHDDGLTGNYRLYPVNPAVRVLLDKSITSAYIEVRGQYRLYNPADRSQFDHALIGKGYPVLPTSEGLKWGESFPDVYQITIVPANANSMVFVNGIGYPGSITVYQVGQHLNIVNEVQVEDYLKLTLPGQVRDQVHDEVLAAITIAARTDTYYAILCSPSPYWNVPAASPLYRGYNGLQSRDVTLAVNATRFLVLQNEGQTLSSGLFAAMWTEHCGGQTTSPQVIFRKDCGNSDAVTSKIAQQAREQSRWSFSLEKTELAALLCLPSLTQVSLFRDPASNKVYAVRFFSGAQQCDLDFLALQQRLGKERLQSSDFNITLNGDSVSIVGYGQGHGVGLCLYTAAEMANHGRDAVEILKLFFPRAQVVMMPRLCKNSK